MADPLEAALDDLDEVRRGLEQAAEALLAAVESGLAALGAGDTDVARGAFAEVMAVASFADLHGQRLVRCRDRLTDAGPDGRPDAHLLAGPAQIGAGLDQAAADALFAEPLNI